MLLTVWPCHNDAINAGGISESEEYDWFIATQVAYGKIASCETVNQIGRPIQPGTHFALEIQQRAVKLELATLAFLLARNASE